MIKTLFYVICFLLVSFSIYSEDETSNFIYKSEIKEFDDIIDGINKENKGEEVQINFLKNSLINNEISSAKLLVELFNQDNGYFKILKAKIMMNGVEIYNKKNIDKKNITIFNSASDPGMYTFNFNLIVEGAGYGIFTYMKSYKFTINRTIKIEVPNIGKSKVKFTIYKNKKGDDSNNPASMLGIKVKIL
jgi:hypothetical protein